TGAGTLLLHPEGYAGVCGARHLRRPLTGVAAEISGGFGMLRIVCLPLGFTIVVLPRSILFCALLSILADEDRGIYSAIIAIGFRHPDGLAACGANAVVLHGPPHTQIRSC